MSAIDTINKANDLLDVLQDLMSRLIELDAQIHEDTASKTPIEITLKSTAIELRQVINKAQQRIIDISAAD